MAAYDMERDEVFIPRHKYKYLPFRFRTNDWRFVRKPVSVFFGRGSYAPSIPTKDVGVGLSIGIGAGLLTAFGAFSLFSAGIQHIDPDFGGVLLHIKGLIGWMFQHFHGEAW